MNTGTPITRNKHSVSLRAYLPHIQEITLKYTESQIKKAIESNDEAALNVFYGQEVYLVKHYADKLVSFCVGCEDREFNLTKFEGNPDLTDLSEAVSAVPFFGNRRMILLNDFNPETDAAYMRKFTEIIKGIPAGNIVLIYETGIELDVKKAKTKKFTEEAETLGRVCEFKRLPPLKAAGFAVNIAETQGVTLSRTNALYLSERVMHDLTQLENEVMKLCAYAKSDKTSGNEITKEMTDALVTERLDVKIYSLTDAVTSRNYARSYRLYRELTEEDYNPIVILGALSGTFTDYYRAKLAAENGKTAKEAANDFMYAANRTWALGKAFSAVRNISMKHIKHCIKVLFETDYKLKSSPLNPDILAEKAITEIIYG
jgi:DNA polymerase-3 subunit delta